MNNRGYPNSNMNSNSYSDSPNITKVSGINPYNANNITLVLKVDNKSSVRTYNNNKGEGKMFSVDLVDDTGEIKCTFFNEGVDQYDPLFEVGKVFRISRAGIKAGNPKFCRTKYEMNINRNTVIVEERSSVPLKRRYNFVASIDSLQDVSPQALVDTIGVIYEIGDVANFNSKDGKELVKRSIRIADSSNRNIEITLWGDLAQNFSASQGSVLAIKNGKVNEFKGEKNISTVSSTLFEIDPEIPESIEITNWYSQNAESIATSTFGLGGGSSSQTSTSSRSNKVGTIAQLLEQAGSGDRKAVYVKVKGTITWINHDDRAPLYYKSCPDNNKKVIENTTGHGKKWLCEATGNYYDDYNLRYILSANVDDTTGSQFVTIFNDHAEFILGCEAKSIESYKDNGDSISLNNIFEGALFKRYFITIKATEEMYQDEMKLRCIIQNIESLDYIAESKKMIDEITATSNCLVKSTLRIYIGL